MCVSRSTCYRVDGGWETFEALGGSEVARESLFCGPDVDCIDNYPFESANRGIWMSKRLPHGWLRARIASSILIFISNSDVSQFSVRYKYVLLAHPPHKMPKLI